MRISKKKQIEIERLRKIKIENDMKRGAYLKELEKAKNRFIIIKGITFAVVITLNFLLLIFQTLVLKNIAVFAFLQLMLLGLYICFEILMTDYANKTKKKIDDGVY